MTLGPISLIAFAIGCVWGARRAAKRGGNYPDMLQYGFAHGAFLGASCVVLLVVADFLI